jgi:hypothetical protein
MHRKCFQFKVENTRKFNLYLSCDYLLICPLKIQSLLLPEFDMPEPIEEGADEDLFILDRLTATPFLPQASEDEETRAGSDAFVQNKSELVGGRGKRQKRKDAMPRGRRDDGLVAGS